MSTIAAKWISSIVLFVCTLAISIVPVIIFNYFTKRKHSKRSDYNIRRTNTFNISSISSSNQSPRAANLSDADNDSITGSGENVIRRTRSNSIGSISSISSRKLNKRSAAILQIFMFFGGGVLLATCFCHLIPEVKENFEKYLHLHSNDSSIHSHNHIRHEPSSIEEASTELISDSPYFDTTISPDLLRVVSRNLSDLPLPSGLHGGHEHDEHDHEEHEHDEHDHDEEGGHHHKHSVPWVEIAICSGFFFMYLIEEIVHTFIHNHTNDDQNTTYKSESIDDIRWDVPYQSTRTDADTHLMNNPTNKTLPCYDNYAIDFNSEPQLAKEQASKRKNSDSVTPIENTTNQVKLTSKETALLPTSVRFMQGMVTIIAFSAHSVFDGLAIGLQTSANQVYTMLFAISMHKLVVAFAVGLEIFGQTSSVSMTSIHMSLFSIMSPIGIWLVIIFQERSVIKEEESLFFIMLSAAATGTIIYIVFFEILQKDRNGSSVNGLLLWLVMLSGFVLMVAVNVTVTG